MPDLLERLRSALADRYAVESEIGRGGMATVFLAEDLRHERKVAIKVLHPELAATLGTDRFLREIKIAAGLNHPHILPLFDSGDAAGLLYYVMPYVEGESLQERLEAEVQLPIDEAVAIAAEVAEGLDHAHRQGVIHRDIKPGNILLSEGHALIADFGIARAIGVASEGDAAATDLAVGTPHYMSPEQATADVNVDGRSDIYALGCVLWEMLAGEPPFGGSTPQVIMARKAVEEAPDVRGVRGRVPEALEACLESAVAPSPADRFATAAEFASALREAVLLGVTPQAVARRKRQRRRRWALVGLAVVVAMGGVLAWRVYTVQRQVHWARTEAGPEIRRLALKGELDSALDVASRMEAVLPNDTTLDVQWGLLSRWLPVITEPAGARVYRRAYDSSAETLWAYVGVTPIDSVRVPLVVDHWRLEKVGYETREFVRGAFGGLWRARKLEPDDSIPPGMVLVTGFEYQADANVPESFSVGDFHLGRFETSNRQYKEFVDAGGYVREEFWVEPFRLDGRTVSWSQATGKFVDRTGQPGPSTWADGAYPEGEHEYPVGGISWYEAAAYARFAGKSLPSLWHLDYAVDDHLNYLLIPRSNFGGSGPIAAGAGSAVGTFGAYDQYGNVREWAYNAREDTRLIFGGGWNDVDHLRDEWEWRSLSPWDRSPENGVRLAQFADTAGIALSNLPLGPEQPLRDYRSEIPAGESDYETYVRLYDYPGGALEPVSETVDTVAGWPVERVSFTGPDGDDRMGVYLFLPRHGRPPYQTVLFFSGYAPEFRGFVYENLLMFDFFLEAGRAVAIPILTGTYQPFDPESGVTGGGPGIFFQPPEIVIRWMMELRRSLDYLQTRPDVDGDRLAYYGMYIGATHAPIFLALDSRIKAAFTETGALWKDVRPPPEVDPFNFLPRVRTPVLMMNGRYGVNFPYEKYQLPMLELLGTPAEHKRLMSGAFLWLVPVHLISHEATPWFDKYLGPVEGF